MKPAAPPFGLQCTPIGRLLLIIGALCYLLPFLILPVGSIVVHGLGNSAWSDSLSAVSLTLTNPLYLESFGNSLIAAAGVCLLCASLAIPVAWILVRHGQDNSRWILLLGVLPLCAPPFLAASSVKAALGPLGGASALNSVFGLVFIESMHYFPLLLFSVLLALRGHGAEIETAVLAVGIRRFRFLVRILLPHTLPGLALGATIVFIKVLDDIATPLALGLHNLLAPQLYLRVTSTGVDDSISSVLALMLIVISVSAWWLGAQGFRRQSWLLRWNPPPETIRRHMTRQEKWQVKACVAIIATVVAIPLGSLFLLSVSGIWSFTALPESLTVRHYIDLLQTQQEVFSNTLLYCGVAAAFDLVVGFFVAYFLKLDQSRRYRWLESAFMGMLALPGIVLAFGYLRFFQGSAYFGFESPWVLIAVALSVRNLPYAVYAMLLALNSIPPQCQEAAYVLGIRPARVRAKITLPLLSGCIFVAFLLCFVLAAFDLSAAMLLVPSETQAPISYSIYLEMQKSVGRSGAAALAILSLGFIALCTYGATVIIRRTNPMLTVGKTATGKKRQFQE